MTNSKLFIQKDLPGNWHQEYITPNLIQAEEIVRTYYEKQTIYQHALIMEGACFGRSLVLDGKTQSTEKDEFIYHEALVHPTMLSHPCPKNIFIGGGGEGGGCAAEPLRRGRGGGVPLCLAGSGRLHAYVSPAQGRANSVWSPRTQPL